jgi:hypothetical protein
MMQKFSLTKRPAETGGSINTRTEMHGKEKVPAHDIKVGGLIIDGEELVALTGCETAYDALYMTDESGLVVPRFICFAPLVLLHKFIGAAVQLWTPVGDHKFSGASLKDITLELKTGGNTEIGFKLQVTSEKEHLDVPGLLNQPVQIAIRSAELDAKREDEPELPLGHSEHTPEELNEAIEEEEDATASALGRKIARDSAKKKRKSRD